MAPWPFFSNAAAKIRTPPARATTPLGVDSSTDYFDDRYYHRDNGHDVDGLDFDDLEPPAPPFAGHARSRTHSRSLSNSLFGSKKKASTSDSPSASSPTLSDAQVDGPASPRKQPLKAKADDSEPEGGTCATCNSKMQWPRGASEYRCSNCLMINDLKTMERNTSQTNGKEGLVRSGTNPSPGSQSQVPPIDFEQTKNLIDQCIHNYLDSRVNGRVGRSSKDSVQEPDNTPSITELPLPMQPTDSTMADGISSLHLTPDSNIASSSASNKHPPSPNIKPTRPSREPPAPPIPSALSINQRKFSVHRKPVPPPAGRTEDVKSSDVPSKEGRKSEEPSSTHGYAAAKTIFKPLEEYIIHTYANWESLNRSFLQEKPRARAAARSDDGLLAVPRSLSQDRNQLTEAPLSNLDAKTLLLGDVAENGLWWTGRDARAHSVGRRSRDNPSGVSTEIVHSRSPRINWQEVQSWYRLVLRAGEDWRQRRRSRDRLEPSDSTILDMDGIEAANIDTAFIEARTHVQRTLLKAAEAILKRPGRPLKRPHDTRFLLILISNPLLYPSGSSPMMSLISKELASLKENELYGPTRSHSVKHTRSSSGKLTFVGFWEQGYAFGIIKRVLGLMSNLPDDCHRHLTAWLSRYHESHYRQVQGLIQSFITYRLARVLGRDKSNSDGSSSGWKSDLFPATDGREARLASRLEHFEAGTLPTNTADGGYVLPAYCNDWQIKAAARVMTLLFAANKTFHGQRVSSTGEHEQDPSSISRTNLKQHGQLLSTSEFYNLRTDYIDVGADFAAWESSKHHFSFCQHPFLLSVGTKIRIMELDSQRQMRVSAREACFENLFNNKALQQHLVLKVRRECLIEDSLTGISEVVAQGFREFKKALKVQFVDEPGVDAGGLKKEWFLLLVREIFDPDHGLFIYDDESRLCYFNPHSFETSDQFFLVGALIGFAIYNLTILDVALPPFLFKRLLASSNAAGGKSGFVFGNHRYTLDDLAEYRPSLARGLKQLLEYDGDVEETYCRDFVIEVERYGSVEQVPLAPNGANIPVTNTNRKEFVDLYIQYLLETQVARQFEPFKRGFNMVCGGNAISLFQPEEIELVIRGSDERLDVLALKSVAKYAGWRREDHEVKDPAEEVDQIKWFWDSVESADPIGQRRLLGFITGSDRIPATGASNLTINIVFAGADFTRFPVARTCFNQIHLYKYRSKEELAGKLWRAVSDSEGFGLK